MLKRTSPTAQLPEGTPTNLLIRGRWVPAVGDATLSDINPATEQKLTDVAAASAEDVNAAVDAARAQLDGDWGALAGAAPGQILVRFVV